MSRCVYVLDEAGVCVSRCVYVLDEAGVCEVCVCLAVCMFWMKPVCARRVCVLSMFAFWMKQVCARCMCMSIHADVWSTQMSAKARLHVLGVGGRRRSRGNFHSNPNFNAIHHNFNMT